MEVDEVSGRDGVAIRRQWAADRKVAPGAWEK